MCIHNIIVSCNLYTVMFNGVSVCEYYACGGGGGGGGV